MEKPIKICNDEWWFKGCFIQRQTHPQLKPYCVFKDTKIQENIGTCFDFTQAKKICDINEVKDFLQGYKAFL